MRNTLLNRFFLIILFVFIGTSCFSQTIISYNTWTTSSGCNIFSDPNNPSTFINVPCTINGTASTIAHLTSIGQPVYDNINKTVNLDSRIVNGSLNHGTEYKIAYDFKQGYSYKITIVAARIIASQTGANVILRTELKNGGSVSNNQCNSTGLIFFSGSGDLTKSLQVYNASFSPTETNYIFDYLPLATAQSSLMIAALPPAASVNQTILIRRITILETPPPAPTITFTLSPSTLALQKGTSTAQTFTVNNVSNTPNVSSYTWNIGATPNGWLYNGSAAPATINTTTNTLTLSSDLCSNSPSNISAFSTIGTTNYPTNNCVVSTTIPVYSISGNPVICNNSVYSIPNLPAGASVTWSIPSNVGSVLQLAQNTPAPNLLTITNQRWYGVNTTLSANIAVAGCPSLAVALPKPIANDNSSLTSALNFSYYQESCGFDPSYNGVTSGSNPSFVRPNCWVYINIGDYTTVTNTSSIPLLGFYQGSYSLGSIYYQNALGFKLPLGVGGVPFTFKLSKGVGACRDQNLLFFTNSYNSKTSNQNSYSVLPNPVKDILTINSEFDIDNNKVSLSQSKSKGQKNDQYLIKIYDLNFSSLIISQKSIKGSIQNKVNVSQLKKGYYILQLVDLSTKEIIQSTKILKE